VEDNLASNFLLYRHSMLLAKAFYVILRRIRDQGLFWVRCGLHALGMIIQEVVAMDPEPLFA
jgi:hypothetical protein